MLKDSRIVYGGGASEISCALTLLAWADTVLNLKFYFNFNLLKFRFLQLTNMPLEVLLKHWNKSQSA
jgi:hypothetical protein